MKFTLSWLKSHLDTNKTSKEIEDKLSLIGLEIEECVDNSKVFEPFIIAEIKEAKKHEDSDKLSICKVFDGNDTFQIVCGAENARSGIKVVLAPIGSEIPANGMVIKQTKIRGVESNGMLCSAEELLLEESSEGIIELPETAPLGSNFGEYANLNDVIFEIGLTPNRGDCANVRGIARDLSAADMGSLKPYESSEFTNNGKDTPTKVIIENNATCREFTLTKIDNITNGAESEFSSYLRKIGFSPKSTLVDLSNYFMMDLGRPNHIYDADKIKGDFTVRYSKKGEKFTPISMEEIELPKGILVVTDEESIVSIAGVIGGELSKVTSGTKNILIEMANFNPLEIMKSGRTLNISTDSRFRIERRIDFDNRESFLNPFFSQILKECGGNAYKINITKGGDFSFKKEIEFDFDYTEKLSGVNIPKADSIQILEKLGFKVNGNKISIPSFRQGDVESKADIVEEIVRIYGYENIPNVSLPTSDHTNLNFETPFIDLLKQTLASRGMSEVFSWSFIEDKVSNIFGFKDCINLINPISSEMSVMRKSLLPSLLILFKKNLDLGNNDLSIFEVASIFEKENPHKLNKVVCGARFGKKDRKTTFKNERNFDFYDSKADLFSILGDFGLNPEKLQYKNITPEYYHPGKSCALYLGKNLIAYVGEIHPKIRKYFDISDNATAFELFIDGLPELRKKNSKPQMVSHKLQSITRDFAFLIKDDVSSLDIKRAVLSSDKKLITDVSFFDIYQGKGIDEGFKSIAFSAHIQPLDSSLSEKEIEGICAGIVEKITSTFDASQR